MCQPRSLRCTERNICLNPNTNMEEGCERNAVSGKYAVYLGRSPLSDSSSSKRDLLEHRFIKYRGFTYEYGKSYFVQILDINDPKYKYKNNKDVKGELELQGFSQCTWEDATTFCRLFNASEYNIATNNCQHFAKELLKTLLTGPCASSQRKRSEQISLEEFVRQLFQNRSCSDTSTNDSSSSYPHVHASVLSKYILAFVATLVVSILMLQ